MTGKLYILPFDHRGSFIKMFGFSEDALTQEAIATIADYKHVVYEGFLLGLEMGIPKEAAAILVDEQFGSKIHTEAKASGVIRLLTVEKSGQDEFDFEYGSAFREHIDGLKPDYVKVLVRYNTEGDRTLNKRQIEKLKLVNDFCHSRGYRFLFELLVPSTKDQLASCGGDRDQYERVLRGRIMQASIAQLQEGGIEPDVWKLEGLDDMNQMRVVVEGARRNGRDTVGIVVLGRGESDVRVQTWLEIAAEIPGVIGFAVGRTVFKSSLLEYHQGKIKRGEAAKQIAENYKKFVDIFEAVRVRAINL